MVRNNGEIKGITIKEKENKLIQFADDTTFLLDGSDSSLRAALSLLGQYAKYSGLKPNIEKTHAMWIGNKMNSQERLCRDFDLKWTSDPIKVLGITFCTNLNDMIKQNYEDKINEIESFLNNWSKRYLTIIGRITVIKSLAISKLVHLFISLPSPNTKYLTTLNKIIYSYLWGSTTDRIARKQIIQTKEDGGLNMIHLESFLKSQKLSWIKRLINNPYCAGTI